MLLSIGPEDKFVHVVSIGGGPSEDKRRPIQGHYPSEAPIQRSSEADELINNTRTQVETIKE